MDSNQLIDALGGSTVVAKLCNVTVGAVSQWRKDGIPAARLMFLKVVRPEVFMTKTPRKKRQIGAEGATNV